jgi:excisionase family DNA binding protein
MHTPDAQLLTTAELARLIQVDVRTVHRMVERGEIKPHIKVPGQRGAYLFQRDDAVALAAERGAA